ncbi:MAG: hypothetical protein LUQ48_02705, partial [Methylococcaceae bacterium]|nr:hypothetical protein [Methylococcaceae bacterium]
KDIFRFNFTAYRLWFTVMGELSHQKYRCSLFVLQSKKALAKGGCFSDQFKKLTHYRMNRRRWQVVRLN